MKYKKFTNDAEYGSIPILLGHQEMAELLGVAPRTLTKLEHGGRIGPKALARGARLKYRPAEVLAWISAGRNGVLMPRRAWQDGARPPAKFVVATETR